jgi:hypothetical protein
MPLGVYLWDSALSADLWRIGLKRRSPTIYEVQVEGLALEPDDSPGLGSGRSAWRSPCDVPPERVRALTVREWLEILHSAASQVA